MINSKPIVLVVILLGEINKDIKHFLNNKGFNLQNYSSKNFNVFVNGEIKIDHVITVCNNANNEVCPIWA